MRHAQVHGREPHGSAEFLAVRHVPGNGVRMAQQLFGLPEIAVRTLEVYTTATLEATLAPAADPLPAWRATMDRLYETARTAYRAIVYEHPRFVDYFRAATPEPELRAIHIGSRPARRGGGEGVASLRAIPWQFAWTQTRLLLASWLGVEAALGAALARGDDELLRAMHERWAFFRSTIGLLEMVLAKTEPRIAAEYDRRLVPEDLQPLGRDLRSRLEQAVAAVLAASGHSELAETNQVLRRAIDVRNPYVDPINLVQIELLDRLRRPGLSEHSVPHVRDGRVKGATDPTELMRAFIVTVNGIAAGMRNTG